MLGKSLVHVDIVIETDGQRGGLPQHSEEYIAWVLLLAKEKGYVGAQDVPIALETRLEVLAEEKS